MIRTVMNVNTGNVWWGLLWMLIMYDMDCYKCEQCMIRTIMNVNNAWYGCE
jgi:hypothetical protein